MEPSNYVQDFTAYMQAGMMATTVYLTVVTGYLIVAYLVGAKLTQSQLVTISILFVAFALLFAYGSFEFYGSGFSMVAERPGRLFPATQYIPIVTFFIELAGIVAALRFMVDIRNKGH